MREIIRIRERFGIYAIGLGLLLCSIAYSSHFSDNYTPTKWGVVYLTAIVSLFYASILSVDSRPLDLKPFRWPTAALIVFYSIGMFHRPHVAYHGQILDGVSFLGLGWTASVLYRRNPIHFLRIIVGSIVAATIAVLTYGFLQLAGFEPLLDLFHNEFPASFFGFQNMTAEFVGYSILIQTFTLLYFSMNNKIRIFLLALVVTSIGYLITLHCRAVYVALVPTLAFLLIYGTPHHMRRKVIFAAVGAALLVGFAIAIPLVVRNPNFGFFDPVKASNANLRIIRWMNTGSLIFDHPMGTGPGSYEFAYLPYRSSWREDYEVTETLLARSPHNTYLGLAAENGIFVAAALIALLWILGVRLIEKLRSEKSSTAVLIFIALTAG